METLAAFLLLTIVLPIAAVCLPSRITNACPAFVWRAVSWLLATQIVIAATLTIDHGLRGEASAITLASWPGAPSWNIGLYIDGTTSLMLLLVSFVGCVVTRFSIRYLDGEATQGRYFQWLAFAIGAVSLMVVAGNLLLFFVAWVMTSFGLHHLLLHYRHRPAAHRAAWTKFAISRLGDLFLVVALGLTFQAFGTFELSELFAKAAEISATNSATATHTAIAWLLMLGAVTKSAQFPFHTWLPDTMETPTPVSALMHAGIVNAGGYLIIRMSPLVSLAPEALLTLAGIGAFTACFAGVVMMTQSSVKRTLAYSTIAQMGFMMLQCGLGAFSAAMLHILAHSLYKAHAFLSSGSVVVQSSSTRGAAVPNASPRAMFAFLAGSATVTTLTYLHSPVRWASTSSPNPAPSC